MTYRRLHIRMLMAICLTIAMVFTLSANVFAADTAFTTDTIQEDISNFSVLNGESTFASTTDRQENLGTYTLNYSIDDESKTMDAELSIALVLMGEEYNLAAEGVLPISADKYGEEYVEGPLVGMLIAGDECYLVNIGLQKFVNIDSIYASIVLQSANDYDIVLACSFGTPVLTENNVDMSTLQETSAQSSEIVNTEEDSSCANAYASSAYIMQKVGYANYSGAAVSGYGQRLRTYYNSSASRVAVGITSYTQNVNNYYKKNAGSLDTVTTGVSKFSIELARDGSDNSYIAGIERNTSYTQNENGVAKAVVQVFKDAFAMLGFPDTLIENFFPGTSTRVDIDNNYSDAKGITVTAGPQLFNMDNTSYCAPVIFQMNKNGATKGYYTAESTMTYKTLYMESSGVLTNYYTNAAKATASVTI